MYLELFSLSQIFAIFENILKLQKSAPSEYLLLSGENLSGRGGQLRCENFRIWCYDISTNQRSHMIKDICFKGCGCLD